MASRTKESPFVELLICWEFYFGLFKVGVLGSPSRLNVSLYFWTSRYKQNYFLLFPDLNVALKGRRSNGITMIQAISWDALANFKQCTTGNVSKDSSLYEVLRNLLRRGQHWLKSKCRNGEINSVRRLQRKVSNKHKLKIFRSFDCQSVTRGLPDTWSPNMKWQRKPSFEDWTFKEEKAEVYWSYMNKSFPTLPQTHCVPIIETKRLRLFREIIPIYCENYTNLINTLCGKDAEHCMDQIIVREKKSHMLSKKNEAHKLKCMFLHKVITNVCLTNLMSSVT